MENILNSPEALLNLLKNGQILLALSLFFIAGIVLALTACMFPMLSILFAVIIGKNDSNNHSRWRHVSLAASYGLGMAIVFTLLGVAAGAAGKSLTIWLQQPWVLNTFGVLLVLLAAAMAGLFTLQIPSSIQNFASQQSQRLPGGKHFSVFLMGMLSPLIFGACVTPALTGALLYIAQTQDMILGASALFSMALGLNVPLLLIALSTSRWLPRAGAWMDTMKTASSLMLLALALWLVRPVWNAQIWMYGVVLWCGLVIAMTLRGFFSAQKALAKIFFMLMILTSGALAYSQIMGLWQKQYDPFDAFTQNLGLSNQSNAQSIAPHFKTIRTRAELEYELMHTDKIVMLDFFADWCVACIEMEKQVFSQPAIAKQLNEMTLLRIDVTQNTEEDQAMLEQFKLFGPPAMIFFDAHGKAIPGAKIIGFQAAPRFSDILKSVQAAHAIK